MEIQNPRRQVEALTWCLDRIKPMDNLFHESANEGDDAMSIHDDRSNDFDDPTYDDFDHPIFDDESVEDHHEKLHTPIWDIYGDSNDEVIFQSIDDHGYDNRLGFSSDVNGPVYDDIPRRKLTRDELINLPSNHGGVDLRINFDVDEKFNEWMDKTLEGVHGIHGTSDENHVVELLGVPATSDVDPFLEQFQWQGEPQVVTVCWLILQLIQLKYLVVITQPESCHQEGARPKVYLEQRLM